MNSQTITTLKADLEKNLKMERVWDIHIAAILKYMDLAYTMGQRDQIKEDMKDTTNQPYIESTNIIKEKHYNPAYGDDRKCVCGHTYYRHFDSYEQMDAIGCKYCSCYDFKEDVSSDLSAVTQVEADLHKLHYDNYPPRDN